MALQNPLQELGKKVGPSLIDHSAYLVRTGMWAGAVAFFVEMLGWHIAREVGDIDKDGWRAIFLCPNAEFHASQVMVQLTEENHYQDPIGMFAGVHLGIKVENAQQVAKNIADHYVLAGFDCSIEPANSDGTKWFVRIPALFTFALEFITADDLFNWQNAARDDLVGAQRPRIKASRP